MSNAAPSSLRMRSSSIAFVSAPAILRTSGKLSICKRITVNRPAQPRCALHAQVKNRLIPAAIPATVPITTGIRDRVLFYLGEFFLWEPLAKVLALFIVCTICMALGSFLFRVADPKRSEAKSPFWFVHCALSLETSHRHLTTSFTGIP